MLLVDNTGACGPVITRSLVELCNSAQWIPTVAVGTKTGNDIKSAVAAGTVTATFTFGQPPPSNPPYGTLSGTSMATPHVSAGAAVVWATKPKCRADVLLTAMKESAVKPSGFNSLACNPNGGCGIMNIPAAINKLAQAAC
jgi:subtilisin family serine protease